MNVARALGQEPGSSRLRALALVGFLFAGFPVVPGVLAQIAPRIGYVYPAGGLRGSAVEVVVGGQYLASSSNAFFSGAGIEALVIEYNRPLNQQEFSTARDRLQELQAKKQSARRGSAGTNTWSVAEEAELTGIRERILKNPPNRQGTPAIAETVTLRVTIATNAEGGEHELRLAARNGLSNPILFFAGDLPETSGPLEKIVSPDIQRLLERLGKAPLPARSESRVRLPVVANGQILPGTSDQFRFSAQRGQHLVFAARARDLIPYLADAVPGWFQAKLILYDAKGKELAFNDDYRFSPDPELFYEVPRDGEYVIEIRDAIYRGREDFVYRLAMGELPWVTNSFPLGGTAGQLTRIELSGWNLGTNGAIDVKESDVGIHRVNLKDNDQCDVVFACDTLRDCIEQEPNSSQQSGQPVALPVIVNGRIGKPGDLDVFSFEGTAEAEIIAEVEARRLGSPLDSFVRILDAAGKEIASNDDSEDRGAGLETHHADSFLRVKLPASGRYYVELRDTQHAGGGEFGYRLRLSHPQPDFALRLVPASANVRAGASVPLTAFVMRRDGFTNSIQLELHDAPPGFVLSGAQIPAGQDRIRFTLTAPVGLPAGTATLVQRLSIDGSAELARQTIIRPAIPAEDMMQAFAYRHLVPAKEFMVGVSGRGIPKVRILDAKVKIPAGGKGRVRIGTPGNGFLSRFELELDDPPPGISVGSVSATPTGLELELLADAQKSHAGTTGNLIVNAFPVQRPAAGRGANNRSRVSAGTLPAISFEIIAPAVP